MFLSRTRLAGTSLLALTSFLFLPGAVSRLDSAPGERLPEVSFTREGPIEQADPFITLAWEVDEESNGASPAAFELQEDSSADFSDPLTRYRGGDLGSFISGLPEGDFYFRVRAVGAEEETGPWSEPLRLTVKYYSLAWAFFLFGIGAVVSIATVGLVVIGDRRSRRAPIET